MTDHLVIPLAPPALEGGAPIYCTGEEALSLIVFNSAAGVTVNLQARFLPVARLADDPPPRVQPIVHSLVPATNRTASTRTEQLGEGWLLDGQVIVTAGTPITGQCYAIVVLVRGKTGGTQTLTLLARGYVTANQGLPICGYAYQGFVDGGGAIRAIVGTTPGAGAEIVETVPTNARWEVIAFAATLTTAVAAANRVPILVVDDGANVLHLWPMQGNETASLAWQNTWSQGSNSLFTVGALTANGFLPDDLWLPAGARLRTSTLALQAADQWSSPKYLVRELIEGQ